jgi:hypothetical protein
MVKISNSKLEISSYEIVEGAKGKEAVQQLKMLIEKG